MERIKNWLNNPTDYQEGITIYKSLKTCNKMLLRNFERTETALNKQKLIYELRKVAQIPMPNIPSSTTFIISKTTTESNKPEQTIESEDKRIAPLFHELPAELRPILLEANNMFKENCLLKTELNELKADQEKEALEIILTIDRNWKANQICWDKIEYFQKHRELPKSLDVPISSYSMDKLLKEQALLQSSVCRQEQRFAENKEKIRTAEGKEINRLQRLLLKQEKDILEKREKLFKIKNEIDVKGAN